MPIFTSSPGDSSIGMNVAAMVLLKLAFNVTDDVNLSAAIVLPAARRACWILGGGSPKNFVLQTEPQIQEVLGIPEAGHDYFLQVTDARPDTGGLSGATPSEAVSWGKVDPERLPDAVVVYCRHHHRPAAPDRVCAGEEPRSRSGSMRKLPGLLLALQAEVGRGNHRRREIKRNSARRVELGHFRHDVAVFELTAIRSRRRPCVPCPCRPGSVDISE